MIWKFLCYINFHDWISWTGIFRKCKRCGKAQELYFNFQEYWWDDV